MPNPIESIRRYFFYTDGKECHREEDDSGPYVEHSDYARLDSLYKRVLGDYIEAHRAHESALALVRECVELIKDLGFDQDWCNECEEYISTASHASDCRLAQVVGKAEEVL